MNRALLDTSFVIALARGEDLALDDRPAEAAISSVTLCGLHRDVLIADGEQRAGRLATLAYAERRRTPAVRRAATRGSEARHRRHADRGNGRGARPPAHHAR
jgi:predicted nucleic acid-binding protein